VLDTGNVHEDWLNPDPAQPPAFTDEQLMVFSKPDEPPTVIVVDTDDRISHGGILAVFIEDDHLVYEPRLGAL